MKIAVFASGTGTTLQTLIEQQAQYGYHISLVVTNRVCMAMERAEKHGIPVLLSKDWDEIDQSLRQYDVKMIVLAGFLAIIPQWICATWDKHIINIHPSLLPKHGGKGMYGIHVQESVLASHDSIAGCTVHYVSAEVDGGAMIAQATVPVLAQDTPETLSLRVQQQEKILLPKVIGELAKISE
jgi:phosphoribosylglycinamide formyltransferase-1